jgi:acetyl-CoA carboxylase carboxyl transferase subunit beta
MAWFRKQKRRLRPTDKRDLPADLWEKCTRCDAILYREKLRENWNVCPQCGHHMRLPAREYVEMLVDTGTWVEHDDGLRAADPLRFVDLRPYPERIAQAERSSGATEAILTGSGRLEGLPIELGVMNFGFIGGSMGSVVGEKIARAAERALEARHPLVLVSASGGARMMEGVLSLMQMAKTAAVLADLHEAAVPYVSVLTDPTTGGVTASFAMLGDVILAEPGALVGFAGPRVIEQTIRQTLPEGFQRAEFLLEHGMIDRIVDRREMKATIAQLLRHMTGQPLACELPQAEAVTVA